jgi:DNA-binding NtrC family response regulator
MPTKAKKEQSMSESLDIMVVDDEETICEALSAWLVKDGHRVETALSGYQALDRSAEKEFDVFLLDIKMPKMDGLELLPRLKSLQPDADVIMITAHGSIKSAVEAMKSGACDYLCKPFDPDELSLLMQRLMVNKALRAENELLREQLIERQDTMIEGFIAHSAAMQEVFATIKEVAASAAPVLITGETGVGKDLVARAIHSLGNQSTGPFVTINCGALSETLLESELFGHERGAFTGAIKARRGRLEMANRGTLFLDEIGEISTKMQVALLKALEEKTFQRVGGNQLIETEFRLVCATHRDLVSLIREERFREDFFYRINESGLDN